MVSCLYVRRCVGAVPTETDNVVLVRAENADRRLVRNSPGIKYANTARGNIRRAGYTNRNHLVIARQVSICNIDARAYRTASRRGVVVVHAAAAAQM